MARAPRDALVGIKAAADAAQPAARPELAAAVASFATTWVGDAHWDAVAKMEERRRQRQLQAQAAPS